MPHFDFTHLNEKWKNSEAEFNFFQLFHIMTLHRPPPKKNQLGLFSAPIHSSALYIPARGLYYSSTRFCGTTGYSRAKLRYSCIYPRLQLTTEVWGYCGI